MQFSGEDIAILLLAGLAAGLLPSALFERKGLRPARDVAIGIVIVFAGYWLVFAWRDVSWRDFSWRDFLPGTAERQTAVVKLPNYEPVVFPLAPLRALLKPIIPRSRAEICGSVAAATRKNDIPAVFFIRLLYQESGFRSDVISSSGALGIAQFMPETASDRRLDNPFDPLQAIPASARLLRDLQRKFGNLGLAAAAYNAGPRRVQDWMTNKASLPQETKDYVTSITGRPVEMWTAAQPGTPAVKLPQDAPCQESAGLLAWNGPEQIPLPPDKPRVTAVTPAAAPETLARNVRAKRGSADAQVAAP